MVSSGASRKDTVFVGRGAYDDISLNPIILPADDGEIKRGSKFVLVGYAEYAYEIAGSGSWMNYRYFEKRDMRPLFVEEIAVHPDHVGLGIGSFMFEQIEHAARRRGCTHIVLEVAENNDVALRFYRNRNFHKLDAAIFLSRKLDMGDDLLSPRKLVPRTEPE